MATTYRTTLSGYIPADDDKGVESQLLFQIMSGPDKGKLLTIPATFYVPSAEREARSLRQQCIDILMLKFDNREAIEAFVRHTDGQHASWHSYFFVPTASDPNRKLRRDALIRDYNDFLNH